MRAALPVAEAERLFDANAATYDRVNTVISLGLDDRWRTWAARRAVRRSGARVLDAFAGTGRTGIRAAELGAHVTLADISYSMLAEAVAEARRRSVSVSAVAVDLTTAETVPGAPFDAVTIVFGVRYLADPVAVIRRLASLLVPGGRVVLLDFAEPTGGLLSRAAAVYFFRVLPRIASALAGRSELYRLLADTTHEIKGAGQLRGYLEDSGLHFVGQKTMGFGLVIGLVGECGSPPREGTDARIDRATRT